MCGDCCENPIRSVWLDSSPTSDPQCPDSELLRVVYTYSGKLLNEKNKSINIDTVVYQLQSGAFKTYCSVNTTLLLFCGGQRIYVTPQRFNQ